LSAPICLPKSKVSSPTGRLEGVSWDASHCMDVNVIFPRRLQLKQIFTIALMTSLFLPGNASAKDLVIGDFSQLDPTGGLPGQWKKLEFPKIDRHTTYRLIRDGRRTVIEAVSVASASGLIYAYHGPTERYPWISWQWKIAHVLQKGNVAAKQGDDYAARIYIAFEFSAEGKSWWQTMRYKAANIAAGGKLPGSAINYIWANKAPISTIVGNPFTDQTKMIVLQSGNGSAGRWIVEKRNLVDDYQAAFGQKPPPIMGIAIMTDTDNTGESTTAYYGDIRMSE
jgi:hypothetical protein